MMMLTGLFNKVTEHFAQAKECRRQIDRQKLMLDPAKIVLMDDFEECFDPHSRGAAGNMLKKYQQDNYGDFLRALSAMAKEGWPVYAFRLPLALVSENSRKRVMAGYEARLAALPAEKENWLDLLDNERKKIFPQQNVVAILQEILKELDELPDNPPGHSTAMYLGTLLEAWDRAFSPFGLSGYGKAICCAGEGQLMVDFYKAVNSLDDYSGKFPNRPPPPGNSEKDKAREKEREKGWQPDLVPGRS